MGISMERKSSLPSKKSYDMKVAREVELKQVRTMTAMDFITQYEDPAEHFLQTGSKVSDLYQAHSLYRISQHFPSHSRKDIEKLLETNKGHFLPTIKGMEKLAPPK